MSIYDEEGHLALDARSSGTGDDPSPMTSVWIDKLSGIAMEDIIEEIVHRKIHRFPSQKNNV